jgi:peptide/nickel transport system permease protein
MATTELNNSHTTLSAIEEAIIELTPRQLLFRRAKSHKGLIIGFIIITFLMLVGLFAPFISPYDPFEQDLPKRLLPPFWSQGGTVEHFFGTDHLGRDPRS